MTKDEQRRQAQQLRQEGYSFGQIARTLGVASSTVKSWCYRTAEPPSQKEQTAPRTCARSAVGLCRLPGTECGGFARMPAVPDTGVRTATKSTGAVPSRAYARSAESHSATMPVGTGSTAATPAISPPGITGVRWMDKQQFRREALYQATLCAVERMRTNGIITDGEYEQCRKMLLEKYDPPVGKIVSN